MSAPLGSSPTRQQGSIFRLLRSDARREFLWRLLLTAGLIALAATLWKLSPLVLLGFAAVLVAVLLRAVSDRLAHVARMPPLVALAFVMLLTLFCGAAIATLFGATVSLQFSALARRLPEALVDLDRQLQVYGLRVDVLGWLRVRLSDGTGMASLTHVASAAGNALGGVLLALVGGAYLAAQPQLYVGGFLSLLPPPARHTVAAALKQIGQALRHWIVGQIATMLIVGFLTGFGAFLIGLPSPLALGVGAGLLEFVPYIGPIATAVPAGLLALTVGREAVMWTLLMLVAVQQLEGYLLTPLIQRRAVSLPPALTLFAMFALGMLFGLPGVLLATPLTVVFYVAVRELYLPAIRGAAADAA